MSALDQHIAALEKGEADDRTQAIYTYFKLMRQEERDGTLSEQARKAKQQAFTTATQLTQHEVRQWVNTPIQDMSSYTTLRQGYRDFPVDTDHPRFADSYVDVRDVGLKGANFYYECNENTYPYKTKIEGATPHLLVRDTVAHFLLMADAMLEKVGLGIYVYDGWRPQDVQASLYKWFEADLQKKNPALEGEALEQEVVKFVSKPLPVNAINPLSPPPHLTGGAVDLAIIDRKTGKPVFTGVPFDEFTEISAPDYYEKKQQQQQKRGADLSAEDKEAQANVRVVFHLMNTIGFVPLDSENWHFELFTQNWSKTKGLDAGFYGAMTPDLNKFENKPWVKKQLVTVAAASPKSMKM